ncbi:P-loop containing nucleoside triphosphate hydrolase [Pseudocohnilembus persalinus]|uniref:p-loop containing nucleoside triphosphate hydrolase n=1 Tax=Pseudocohnilembus persalinus TaxID=266149 RepID=A0A0V0QCF0_PSEPJ|nr:P-loop containing nucleoside triphosphate hydrolase [Pseudocohnilembus persalinus]|eukprot:KRW99907.1 P-loop containing nucleoside triphosphate hydrolase [Pseudocohnilembus persalinus]
MEQEKENQKTEQMEIEENQESSEAQQEKLREAKRSIQKKYAQKLQDSDDDENSNQDKQKKQEQKDEDYQEKNQDQNQNQKSEISKKEELIKKNESQLDSVESRMQKLLEKAEKYTDFLIKRHQNRKSSMSLQERKKRGNWEDEQEEEKELLDDEEGQTEKNTYLQKQPSILKGGELKSYQLLGLNWMISLYESGLNGILADQMGLGKTIQTISLVAFLREFKKIKGPFLIFGPKSTLGNWQKEFAKWLPAAKLVKLIATKEERGEILDKYISTGDFDVCLTSFEGVKICANYLKKISWQYMIIDEAHKLKNEESQLSKMIRTFDTKNKLLLTGTPLQNNLHELWSLLNFILPDLFKDSDIFDDWFSANQNQNVGGDVEQKNLDMIKQLHKILKPFMIRRTKAEVEKTMPPKKEIHLFIGLSGLQIDIYKKLLKKQNLTGDNDQQKKHYLNTLMQLRKCCNHPYLFEGVEDENLPVLGEHLVENCGKMRVLDKLLVKLHKEKHQVLIFSQMTMLLDVLEDYCNLRQYNYCRIDGSTDMDTRDKGINDFTKPNSDKFIFLLSTRAGGLGINLMTADTVVLYDSDWNPQMDLQAMDRAHRIGQKNQVNVYRFISENTVEEKIVERQTIKLRWDNLVIQQGKLTQKQKQLNKDELKDIIQHGAASIFKVNDGQGTFNDQEIDKLLERGDQKTKQFNDEIAKRLGSVAEGKIADKQNQEEKEEKDSEMNLGMQQINIYDFMDFNKNKEDEQVLDEIIARELEAQNETNRSRRDKKTMNYNINQQFMMQMQPTLPGQGSKIPEPKKIRLPEHQFFVNREKLQELLQLEEDYRVQNLINEKKELAKRENERRKLNNSRYHRYNREKDRDRESNQQQEESQNQNEESQQQEKEKFEPKSCSWYVDLSEEEKEEKERLYKTGFPGWLKSDFESFVQGCTKYGRDNIEKIAKGWRSVFLQRGRRFGIFVRRFSLFLQYQDQTLGRSQRVQQSLLGKNWGNE